MAEYYVRRALKGFRLHSYAIYDVVKFEGGEAPAALYQVTVTQEKQTCTCPAFTKPDPPPPHCKHMLIVGRWLSDGEPEGRAYHAG